MTLNTSNKDAIIMRREMVASLRLRGLSLREITAALAKQSPPIVNPKSGKPYDVATIKSDVDALKAEWHKSSAANTDEHQARQFAELQEIKRAAWSQKSPQLALQALDKEMKLLGTMRQPDGINVNLLVVVQRFEAAAKELQIEPTSALDQFIQAMYARRDSGSK